MIISVNAEITDRPDDTICDAEYGSACQFTVWLLTYLFPTYQGELHKTSFASTLEMMAEETETINEVLTKTWGMFMDDGPRGWTMGILS